MNPSFFEWYIAANSWSLIVIGLFSLSTVAALIMACVLSAENIEGKRGLLKCQWILETSYTILPALGALGTIWNLWSATATRAQWEAASRNMVPALQQALVPIATAVLVMLIAAIGHAITRYKLIDP